MRRSYSWKPTAAIGLFAAALLLSLAALAALGAQIGPLMWSRVIGLAESHDKIAFQIIAAGSRPAALAKAAAEAQHAVDLAPYDNSARLRIAYVSTLGGHRLEGAGLARYAESYDLIPYDNTVAAWRIGFGLEHWAELSPELRTTVHAEAMAFIRGGHGVDADIHRTLESIHNPQGRLAAALWLRARVN